MRHEFPLALASGAAQSCPRTRGERMPRWRVKEAVLVLSAVTLLACGNPREKAREKLGQMNIKYSDDTFLERVKDGDVVVVGHFLTAGMSLNVTDQEGKTPLIVAARAGRLEVVELLLKKGADVNGKDKKFGATPLVWTALGDSGENKELITLLLSRGANVESREEKSAMTPVLSAAARGHEETVRLLLDKGAKVNDTDNDGRTPLMWAAQNGHASTVALLLKKGADLKLKEQKGGLDALIAASGRGRSASVRLLLQKGANPRSVDKEGKTVLMWAARNGNAETVQFLLDAGADLNAPGQHRPHGRRRSERGQEAGCGGDAPPGRGDSGEDHGSCGHQAQVRKTAVISHERVRPRQPCKGVAQADKSLRSAPLSGMSEPPEARQESPAMALRWGAGSGVDGFGMVRKGARSHGAAAARNTRTKRVTEEISFCRRADRATSLTDFRQEFDRTRMARELLPCIPSGIATRFGSRISRSLSQLQSCRRNAWPPPPRQPCRQTCVNLVRLTLPVDFTVRIVVADPQPVFRYGLKRLLDETQHLRVVGEADNPAQAVQAVRQLEADVLVINPGTRRSGLDALKALDGLPKPVRCIVLTNGDQRYAQLAAWQLPVAGVLPRESSGRAFVNCIQAVMQNQRWFGAETATIASTAAPSPAFKTPYRLTRREAQILSAVADGASNKDIAAQFSIAEDTVKHHLSNIFNKVGVDSRLELAVFAVYHGLVQWT